MILFIEVSSKECIRGFPDIPVTEVNHRTSSSSITTLLIPDLNFTCNASIVGFIVTGGNFYRSPYSKLQIWRNDHSKNSVYSQVRSGISVNLVNGGPVCVASWVVGALSWCILDDDLFISIQPGDILGLELPRSNSEVEIFFTRRGPINFVFERQLGLSSTANLLSNRSFSEVQQLPQIIFNLTAGVLLIRTCA